MKSKKALKQFNKGKKIMFKSVTSSWMEAEYKDITHTCADKIFIFKLKEEDK